MFNNVGNKLKIVAKIYFWVMVAVSVVLALTLGITVNHSLFRAHNEINALLPLFLIGGPACSYVCSLMIYGLGQLVENTSNGEPEETKFVNPFKKNNKKVEKEETVVEAEVVKTEEVKNPEEKTENN